MRRAPLITCTLALLLLLSACGTGEPPGTDPAAPADDPAAQPDDPAGPDADPGGDFDRETARADAEALLGTPEDEITETPDRRVVRRGDEEFVVTMDLRPGRQNLELDDDGTGTYVVARVVVETPEGGDDNLVVE
jgi:hypothetical protein